MENASREHAGNVANGGTRGLVWLLIVTAAILAFSSAFPVWLLVGIAITSLYILAMIAAPHRRLRSTEVFVAVVVVYSLVAYVIFFGPRCTSTFNTELKADLHAIQLALERYAADHGGSYPMYIELLRSEGYMPETPRNPYASAQYRGRESEFTDSQWQEVHRMQPLGESNLIDNGVLALCGNFLYLPQSSQAGGCGDYELLVFGRDTETTHSGTSYDQTLVLLTLKAKNPRPQPAEKQSATET